MSLGGEQAGFDGAYGGGGRGRGRRILTWGLMKMGSEVFTTFKVVNFSHSLHSWLPPPSL